jgi:hypothetical protein
MKRRSITSVIGSVVMVGTQVSITGSVKFLWSPFVMFSVYRKPIMKFMRSSDQIKHNTI